MAFVPCVLRPRYYSGGPSASVPDPLLLPELSKLSFSPFALLPPLAPYKCRPYTLLGPPLLLGPLAGSADPSPSDRPLDVYTPWTEPLRSLPPPSGGEGVGAPPCEIWPHSVFPPPPASCRLIIRRLGRHLHRYDPQKYALRLWVRVYFFLSPSPTLLPCIGSEPLPPPGPPHIYPTLAFSPLWQAL
jgi:hypothetical protein